MEQLPPGTEAELLALLVDIAGALDRADQHADFAAALAAVRPSRDATTLRARAAAGDTTAITSAAAADPSDAPLAIAAAALDADDATALARLDRAARWNPHDVAVRAAILARDPTRTTTTAELAAIAADRSLPAATRRAAALAYPAR
jgi:hypothetical protein